MPGAKAVTLEPKRRPRGPSWRQSEGKPMEAAGLVLPTQGPWSQPTPVTRPIFSDWESWSMAASAFV